MTKSNTEVKLPKLHRTGKINAESAMIREGDEDTRTVELSFSSEEPYSRWWGVEVLGHKTGEVDLDWVKGGTAPLLMDHNTKDQIGVIDSVRLDGGRGTAVVRFGPSPRANEILEDVRAGIRSNISVGYTIREMILESEKDDVATYRVTDWQPLEVSIVSIPADPTVGIGRDLGDGDIAAVKIVNQRMEDTNMPGDTPAVAPASTVDENAIRAEANTAALERVNQILAMGRNFGMEDEAFAHINDGGSVDAFKDLILAKQKEKAAQKPVTELGMDDKDIRRYSIFRAVRAAINKDWSKAGLEREASIAVQEALGRDARGFFVPYDFLVAKRTQEELSAVRDLNTGTPSSGGDLVATDHMASAFIDLLRNRSALLQLGVNYLNGLVGDVDIPRQTGGATAYWLNEGENVTASELTVDSINLTPKTVAGKTLWTRRMMLQSSPSVEALAINDLLMVLALAIDAAGLNGDPAQKQPRGVMNLTGIGAVPIATNGGAPTWGHIVDLETEVAADNADVGTLSYLTNSRVRGLLKQTPRVAGQETFIWQGGQNGRGELNGYNAAVSNQVPSNLTKGVGTDLSAMLFGNWSDMIVGEWGVLDLNPDPYTNADSGGAVIRAFQDLDIQYRHPESFALINDMVTP